MIFSTNKAFFVITLFAFAFILSKRQSWAQGDKKILSANSRSAPASVAAMKFAKTQKPWDRKGPKMILALRKPILEVLNHSMRILVKSDKDIFHLKGQASDLISGVALIYVNGNEVKIDQKGHFEAYIHLAKAYNLIKIEAVDKSGNSCIKEVAVQRTTPVKKTNNVTTDASAAERWITPVKK